MSHPSATTSDRSPVRPRLLRTIRLSTFLLVTIVVGLLIALFVQRLQEMRLREAIAIYRNPRTEGIIDALEEPIALGYTDESPLDQVLKDIKQRTTKNPKLPGLPTGIPIYVDPIGLQEAERSLNATVHRPPAADMLTLGEHLRRILEPLGLSYQVRDGFLMIGSKDSEDVPLGESRDPYLLYHDVLR